MKATKQVIVMRTDLNMRKGKMVAQGAHAAMSFLTKYYLNHSKWDYACYLWNLIREKEVRQWIRNSFVKICVGVDSRVELHEIRMKAQSAGLRVYLMTDNGATEFGGRQTDTCLAIGPNYSEDIDKVTGDLKLL